MQSTDKQKDGEQTPLCKNLQAGVVRPSDNPLTAEGLSGGGYEPRRIHKQWLKVFIGLEVMMLVILLFLPELSS